jgi:hypothetical protein
VDNVKDQHLIISTEHTLGPGVHLLFLDKLATLCGRDSFFYSGKEPGFVVKIANQDILGQSFRVGTRLGGHLRQLRFLL